MFIRLPIPQFYMDSLNNKTVLLFLQVNALLKTYCPLNCSLNGTDLHSLDTKGGFNTLVRLHCYTFKAVNIHMVQYPFGLNPDCLALFLGCIY